ncbi:MAG: SIS domain-containing protein, partial [Acidobacteria bacterium]|nr:SIS domain-containing protein [Acidobacteriota bacterium]
LSGIADFLVGRGAATLERAAALLGSGGSIALIGMGGSRYAAIPAGVYLAQAGINARVLDASELLYYDRLPAGSVAVLVSRSGRTVEMVKLAANLHADGVPFIAVKNCPDSPLCEFAAVTLPVASEPDDGVSIHTFTGAVLTLVHLAAAVAGKTGEMRAATAEMLAALPAVLSQWEVLAPALRPARHYWRLARGPSLSAACEGCLLMNELARRPATWYNAAEFRQGPIEGVSPEDAIFVFVSDGPTAELNRVLARDLNATGASVWEIASPLPLLPECLASIPQILPIQLIAYSLAIRSGILPGEFRYAASTTVAEEGLAPRR